MIYSNSSAALSDSLPHPIIGEIIEYPDSMIGRIDVDGNSIKGIQKDVDVKVITYSY